MFTRQITENVSVLSSYGSCETRNKQCGSCTLTTKLVTPTNYYYTETKNGNDLQFENQLACCIEIIDSRRNHMVSGRNIESK